MLVHVLMMVPVLMHGVGVGVSSVGSDTAGAYAGVGAS